MAKTFQSPEITSLKVLPAEENLVWGGSFGFQLHLIDNQVGELLAFKVTTGNVNDRTPVKGLCQGLTGNLFADKGYLGEKLFEQLFKDGLELITNLRSNLKMEIDFFYAKDLSLITIINNQLNSWTYF